MSKHTQGPWIATAKLSASENHRGFRIMDGANTWALADVQPGDEDGEIGRANAHLIAAAPAMLEALEKLVYTLEDEVLMHDDQRAAMTQARAAIKAARGEA